MPLVHQIVNQNITTKRQKIHRNFSEISRKVIAFEEIIQANGTKSAREIVKLLYVPNSTMQTWRKQKTVIKAINDEIILFFTTAAGSTLLSRIVMAIMYNNKCGASGIRGVQECLRNSGLDKYVTTSIGALQNFWLRFEDCILDFGKQWEQKLAKKMKAQKITIILDEMFRKSMPCLVAIEAVSNYILFEKFAENRTAETWKRELDNATKELPITIGQICSDLCGAIRSVSNEYGANHSPDIFHGQYEISKATAGALNSQERSAEKAFNEAEEKLQKIINKPCRTILEQKKKQKAKEEAINRRNILKVKYEERRARREKTQEAKKELGKIYHPISLDTGKLQSAEIVEKKINEQFEIIYNNAKNAGLSQSGHDRIEKAKRAFTLMVNFLNRFFLIFTTILLNMKLPSGQEVFFMKVVFPLSYLKMIWKRLSKKDKERLAQLLQNLQQKFEKAVFSEESKKALMRLGKEIAETFQRSSSSVEGRNGVLSLLMHRFHHLNEKTLKVLGVVHNFGVKRKGDGSTAAERFFQSKHDNLFEYLVKNVKIPGKPRTQNRRKKQVA